MKKINEISTAPKDGRRILLWGAYGFTSGSTKCGFVESQWDTDAGDWETPIGAGYGVFTHWCELPDFRGLPESIKL